MYLWTVLANGRDFSPLLQITCRFFTNFYVENSKQNMLSGMNPGDVYVEQSAHECNWYVWYGIRSWIPQQGRVIDRCSCEVECDVGV